MKEPRRQRRPAVGMSARPNRFCSALVLLLSAGLLLMSCSTKMSAHCSCSERGNASNLLGTHDQCDAETLDAEETAKGVGPSRFWGTWRPNLYFGTRTQSPETVLTGIMWFSMSEARAFLDMRHECKHSDGLLGFGYEAHNGHNYARQTIPDLHSNLMLTTEWVLYPASDSHGDEWVLKVSGRPINQKAPMAVSMLYYAGRVSFKDPVNQEISYPVTKDTPQSRLLMSSQMDELGDFSIHVASGSEGTFKNSKFSSAAIESNEVWMIKDFVLKSMTENYKRNIATEHMHEKFKLADNVFEPNSKINNVDIVQLFFNDKFEFYIIYTSRPAGQAKDPPIDLNLRVKNLMDDFEKSANQGQKEFNDNFKARFENTAFAENQLYLKTAKFAFANLIGGMGYFYGESIISPDDDNEEAAFKYHYDTSLDDEERENLMANIKVRTQHSYRENYNNNEKSLFTATPSRSFFPRGFLWDEGFHQLILSHWDLSLSTQALTSWLNLMDDDGWIAREQILGEEARSRVPREFQEQKKFIANPPAIMFAIKNILRISKNDKGRDGVLAFKFLKSAYPLLKRHIEWMMRTQSGRPQHVGRDSAFRWRGRTMGHTFASGLDDYPRLAVPSLDELHVDLTSWIAFALKILGDVAITVNKPKDNLVFSERRGIIEKALFTHFWDKKVKIFGDIVPNDISLTTEVLVHRGYISLMPWLLLPENATIEQHHSCLDVISELLSPYGVRSLSAKDKYYGKDDDYWRGRVWINFQYLILRALKHFEINRNCQKSAHLYNNVRTRVISAITSEFKRTGHIYETYSDRDGRGVGTHPFTGWSSLIILILREDFD